MVKQAAPIESLSKMRSSNILVIGDVLLDQYTYGSSQRISPEAPVPVVLVEKRQSRLGGAGNVALNLKALGMMPRIVSRVGADKEGDAVRVLFGQEGIEHELLFTDPQMKTPAKTRVIANGQQLVRVDDEIWTSLSPEGEKSLEARLDAYLDGISLVAISDYGKGMLTSSLLKTIFQKARERGIPCIVDPKGTDFRKYSGATVIKPNASETLQAFGGGVTTIDEAVLKIFDCVDVSSMIVTLSEKGIALYERGKERQIFPVVPKEVRDVTGAGDTVLAALAACMASNMPFEEALPLANIAAACAIERVGCAAISFHDIVMGIVHASPTGKICTKNAFQAICQACLREKIVVIHIPSPRTFAHSHMTRLQQLLLLHKKDNKIVVACVDERATDDLFLQFLSSFERIDFIVQMDKHLPAVEESVEEVFLEAER